uniref:AKTx n=1 Tax=Centruroides hentzi TaxID=88313 RepID=A0A2I9LNQ7_9SCOR
MKFVIALLLLSILTITTVPTLVRGYSQCQRDSDCQRECMTVDRCQYGTCYCKTTGK